MSELQRLAAAWLNGEATCDEQAELDRRLSASEDDAQSFAKEVALHYLLRDAVLTDNSVPLAVTHAIRPPSAELFGSVHPSKSATESSRSLLVLGGVSLVLTRAAMLVLLAGRVEVQPNAQGREGGMQAVAMIDPDSTARKEKFPDRSVFAGSRIQFNEGRMTLKFGDDAVVNLEGDVDFEVESAKRAVLHRGQLTATVSRTGRGFTIATPQTEVVDLGTRFGVNVGTAKQADVVVFDGEVDIGGGQVPPGQEGAHQRLLAGEALRLEEGGQQTRIPMIWQRSSDVGMEWSSSALYEAGGAISSVSDNLSRESRPKFYAVIPGGFVDNPRAYVDRPYVWGGWGGASLPAELTKGDYIQTFNDDKSQVDIEMQIDIPRPTNVYVLFDSREETPPDWLTSQFVNTGLDVALRADPKAFGVARAEARNRRDGPSPENADNRNYSEYRFSVWRRDVLVATTLRLGANSSNVYRGMYGIVAVSRDPAR